MRIAGIYSLFGVAWIIFSDSAMVAVAPSLTVFSHVGVWKGVAFVLLSALVIYRVACRQSSPSDGLDPGQMDIPPGTWAFVLIFALLAAVIVLLGLGGVAYTGSRQKAAEIARLQAIADLKTSQIAKWLEERQGDAEILRSEDFLVGLGHPPRQVDEDSRSKGLARLETYRKAYGYKRIAVIDERGEVLLSVGDIARPSTRLLETATRAMAEGRILSTDLYREPTVLGGDARLDLVAPVPATAGEPRLAVALSSDPSKFLFPFLQSWPVPSSSAETLLFRQDGDSVLVLNELRHRSGTALSLRLSLDQDELLAVQTIQGRVPVGEPVVGLDYRNVPSIGVARIIPGASWILLVKLDQDEIYAQARWDAGWIALADLLALMAAAVLTIFIHQRRELAFSKLQRQQQKSLRESEARFRALAALSSDWYWEQDAEYRFISYSDSMVAGMPWVQPGYMIGKRRWELPSVGLTEAQWAAHRAQLERRESFRDLEYGWAGRDGRRRYFSISGEPRFDADGVFIGYHGVTREITARKAAEEVLRQSEARLAGIVASALDGIVILDRENRITIFNPAAEAIFGYRADEVLRQDAELLFPGQGQRAVSRDRGGILGRPLADPQAVLAGFTLTGRRKDGAEIILAASISCYCVGNEPLQTYILRDITLQLAAERRLLQLSAAVEQSPVSIVITDPAGDIEYVNPRFTQISGFTLDEVRGRNPRIMMSGETPPEVYRTLWDTIRSGREWSGELRNRKKNGDLLWEFVRIMPVVSMDGSIVNYVGVKEDITERREQEKRERLRQEKMLHSARLISMGEMAGALAHELNQPLTAITNFSGVAEQLLNSPNADRTALLQVVRMIIGQALRAGEIVWRTRDFVNKRETRPIPVDIDTIIQDTVRLAEISLYDQSVLIDVDMDPALPRVVADRIQIEQVLLNLITNGAEAMADVSGDKRLAIRVRFAEPEDGLLVEVRDRGCGLPDSGSIDIFAPFLTTKPEGMGMGLAICRGIVESHGGRLWAEGQGDGGSSFFFTLPAANKDGANE